MLAPESATTSMAPLQSRSSLQYKRKRPTSLLLVAVVGVNQRNRSCSGHFIHLRSRSNSFTQFEGQCKLPAARSRQELPVQATSATRQPIKSNGPVQSAVSTSDVASFGHVEAGASRPVRSLLNGCNVASEIDSSRWGAGNETASPLTSPNNLALSLRAKAWRGDPKEGWRLRL